MTELESVRQTKEKQQAKPASKKSRAAKVLGYGAVATAVAGVARHALQKRMSAAPIVIPDDMPVGGGTKVGTSAQRKLKVLREESLAPVQVAEMLGTTTAAVMRRIRARTLYAISFGSTLLLPQFQFRQNAVLRGLDEVLPRLDARLHPIEVINWFTIRNPDLVVGGKAVSPVDWLERGGDIGSVAGLAGEVGSGL